ncbi:4-amino-4-deoxy-L-arabinose-phosphoundecaprenol flippase subunit ArnE [Serratia sp. UGAL515B_01]|uniref:4-amino-4-deoxy-L-arabinose-phosphoundecaprenol flippase subunit ArnE n=1 Tax=Serratia sp. UGAL515B_01 TaxID=2986763 RepID=UPI0039857C7D
MAYLLVIMVSLLTCAGQLCQKQAAQVWQQASEHRLVVTLRWLVLAIISLGLGMAIWLIVLQRLPLSLAYPMLSFNFVLVTLAASWLFNETTTLRHWLGVGAIVLGILLMSFNP